MDTKLFFLKGLIIGFSIAAPVGPIGLLCIQRTLAKGMPFGFISGLGAATADAVYGCIAGLGLTFISSFLISQQALLSVIGGLFLIYLGYKTYFSEPGEKAALTKEKGMISFYISTFLLTLTNPVTILSFIAIFAGLGLANVHGNYTYAMVLVSGVFSGSLLWWLILSSVTSFIRKKFNFQSLKVINKISGIIIMGFGLFAVTSLVK